MNNPNVSSKALKPQPVSLPLTHCSLTTLASL